MNIQGDLKDRLITVNRPDQVGEFMAYHRRLDRRPRIKDLQEYGYSWEAWHKELKYDGYKYMAKGGGNRVFLLILAFRWWTDTADELPEGDLKEWSSNWLTLVMKDLDKSMAGVLGSSALQRAVEGHDEEENDSEEESRPKKR
jgi:hypothetical protein